MFPFPWISTGSGTKRNDDKGRDVDSATAHGRIGPEQSDGPRLNITPGFTGAEQDAMVDDARREAFDKVSAGACLPATADAIEPPKTSAFQVGAPVGAASRAQAALDRARHKRGPEVGGAPQNSAATEQQFITHFDEPGFDELREAILYLQSGRALAETASSYRRERGHYSGIAEWVIREADARFVSGDERGARSLLNGASSIVDDIFNYEAVLDNVTAASTFVGGTVDSFAGVRTKPLAEYKLDYEAGRLLGGSLKVLAEAAGAFELAGITLTLGGGFLAGSAAAAGTAALAPVAAVVASAAAVGSLVLTAKAAVDVNILLHESIADLEARDVVAAEPPTKDQSVILKPGGEWFHPNSGGGDPLPDIRYAQSFSGGGWRSRTLKVDRNFFRVGDLEWGLGEYYSMEPGLGELQLRVDRAIPMEWKPGQPARLEAIYEVRFLAGTRIHVGPTATQGSIFFGGPEQILTLEPWTKGAKVVRMWRLPKR